MSEIEIFDHIVKELRKNPGHMYVTESMIACAIPDSDRIFVVAGDFRDVSDEEANRRLQEAIKNLAEQ